MLNEIIHILRELVQCAVQIGQIGIPGQNGVQSCISGRKLITSSASGGEVH